MAVICHMQQTLDRSIRDVNLSPLKPQNRTKLLDKVEHSGCFYLRDLIRRLRELKIPNVVTYMCNETKLWAFKYILKFGDRFHRPIMQSWVMGQRLTLQKLHAFLYANSSSGAQKAAALHFGKEGRSRPLKWDNVRCCYWNWKLALWDSVFL